MAAFSLLDRQLWSNKRKNDERAQWPMPRARRYGLSAVIFAPQSS
jgi:hypothetical protein